MAGELDLTQIQASIQVFMSGVVDELRTGVTNIQKKFSDQVKTVSENTADLSKIIKQTSKDFQNLNTSEVIKNLDSLQDSVKKGLETFNKISENINPVLTSFNKLAQNTTDVSKILVGLKDQIGEIDLATDINKLNQQLKKEFEAIDLGELSLEEILNKASFDIETGKLSIQGVSEQLEEQINSVFKKINLSGISDSLKKITEQLQEAILTIPVKDLIEQVINLKEELNKIPSILLEPKTKEEINLTVSNLSNLIEQLNAGIAAFDLAKLNNIFENLINLPIQQISDQFNDLFNNLDRIEQNLTETLKEVSTGLNFGATIAETIKNIQTSLEQFNATIEAINVAENNSIVEAIQQVQKSIEDLATILISVGQNLTTEVSTNIANLMIPLQDQLTALEALSKPTPELLDPNLILEMQKQLTEIKAQLNTLTVLNSLEKRLATIESFLSAGFTKFTKSVENISATTTEVASQIRSLESAPTSTKIAAEGIEIGFEKDIEIETVPDKEAFKALKRDFKKLSEGLAPSLKTKYFSFAKRDPAALREDPAKFFKIFVQRLKELGEIDEKQLNKLEKMSHLFETTQKESPANRKVLADFIDRSFTPAQKRFSADLADLKNALSSDKIRESNEAIEDALKKEGKELSVEQEILIGIMQEWKKEELKTAGEVFNAIESLEKESLESLQQVDASLANLIDYSKSEYEQSGKFEEAVNSLKSLPKIFRESLLKKLMVSVEKDLEITTDDKQKELLQKQLQRLKDIETNLETKGKENIGGQIGDIIDTRLAGIEKIVSSVGKEEATDFSETSQAFSNLVTQFEKGMVTRETVSTALQQAIEDELSTVFGGQEIMESFERNAPKEFDAIRKRVEFGVSEQFKDYLKKVEMQQVRGSTVGKATLATSALSGLGRGGGVKDISEELNSSLNQLGDFLRNPPMEMELPEKVETIGDFQSVLKDLLKTGKLSREEENLITEMHQAFIGVADPADLAQTFNEWQDRFLPILDRHTEASARTVQQQADNASQAIDQSMEVMEGVATRAEQQEATRMAEPIEVERQEAPAEEAPTQPEIRAQEEVLSATRELSNTIRSAEEGARRAEAREAGLMRVEEGTPELGAQTLEGLSQGVDQAIQTAANEAQQASEALAAEQTEALREMTAQAAEGVDNESIRGIKNIAQLIYDMLRRGGQTIHRIEGGD